MKKVLCVLLAAMMLLTMAACGAKPETTDPTKTQTSVTEATKPQKETTEATKETQKEEAMQEFRFPAASIYCEVPESYGRETDGYVAVATGCDEYIATVFCGEENTYTGDLEGILSFAADDYADYTAIFLLADLNAEELKNVSCEKTTASGYDAVKFGSTVKNKSDKNYEIYGYAMIIENRPVMIVGVLRSEEQAKADLEEMQDLIDLMAGSIYK